jgi:hypothetical protein
MQPPYWGAGVEPIAKILTTMTSIPMDDQLILFAGYGFASWRKMKSASFAVLLAIVAIAGTVVSLPGIVIGSAGPFQPPAPDFGPNVLIFDPTMTTIQSRINDIFKRQERSEFGSGRYAYLFKPGAYNLDVQIGFYMEVLGLGRSPDAVSITGAVRSKAAWMKGNATCNFWRCVENLSVTPTRDANVNVWAVSQGTALRRTHIKGNLNLWDHGWSSGGFMADCKIDGQVNSGSQQQWLSRNSDWDRWNGGVWNMVFLGVTNPPQGAWPKRPYTAIDQTPVIREKPYLFIDDSGLFRHGSRPAGPRLQRNHLVWWRHPRNSAAD